MKIEPNTRQVLWQAAEAALVQLRGQGHYRAQAILQPTRHRILLQTELRGAQHDLHHIRVVIGHNTHDTYYQWQGGLHYLKYADDMLTFMAAACACARGLPHCYTQPDRATYKS